MCLLLIPTGIIQSKRLRDSRLATQRDIATHNACYHTCVLCLYQVHTSACTCRETSNNIFFAGSAPDGTSTHTDVHVIGHSQFNFLFFDDRIQETLWDCFVL